MSADAHADTAPVEPARKVPRGEPAPGCPVHLDADGIWRVESFASARALLRSTETRQAGFGVENAAKTPRRMRPPVVWRDGPEHREHRRQTARFFTPRRVNEKYQEPMHRYAREQCDRLRRLGRADLSDLSFTLAVAVAGDVVGLSPVRPGMARRLDRFFTEHPAPPGWASPRGIYRKLYTSSALAAFYVRDVRPAIAARRRQRRDDLISHLLDEGCSNAEVLGECVTFAAAGMITTREFITVAAWHLFTDDDLRAAYVNGDQAGRLAILEEILRVEPVVADLARWTTAEVSVPAPDGPVRIPAGARVDVRLATANVDPSTIGPQPGQLCPARPLPDGVARSGLSFGDGAHRCPGAHVAIQETEIFLTKLFALPNLRMAQPPHIRIRAEIASYELVGLIVTAD
jgi:cytochrome P450